MIADFVDFVDSVDLSENRQNIFSDIIPDTFLFLLFYPAFYSRSLVQNKESKG